MSRPRVIVPCVLVPDRKGSHDLHVPCSPSPFFHSSVPLSDHFFFGWKNARTVPVFAPNPIPSKGISQ